jgi:hypothetical protein
VYAGLVALFMLSSAAGLNLGRFNSRRVAPADRKPLGGGATAAVAGLPAFMLAFTLSSAASRFQDRKHLVVEDANAIGTAYLRTQFVADPQGSSLRLLLRQYVEDRVNVSLWNSDQEIRQGLARSGETQARMWAQVTELAREQPDSVVVGLLASAVNDLIDTRGKRVAIGLRARIPSIIWRTVIFMAIMFTVLMEYDMGVTASRSTRVTLATVMTFSAVLVLIIDLDRPQQAMFSVSQDAMRDLLRGFGKGTP